MPPKGNGNNDSELNISDPGGTGPAVQKKIVRFLFGDLVYGGFGVISWADKEWGVALWRNHLLKYV